MTNRARKYFACLAGSVSVFFMVVIPAGDSSASMYKWVDENGVVHIADTPPHRADNEKIEILPAYQTGRQKPREPEDVVTDAPPVVQQGPPVKERRVELYATSWCPWCKKARAFFQSRGIPVVVYDIEKDREAAHRKDRLDNKKGVPFAVIDGVGIHGYSEEAYEKALRR